MGLLPKKFETQGAPILTEIAVPQGKTPEMTYRLYDESGLYLEVTPTGRNERRYECPCCPLCCPSLLPLQASSRDAATGIPQSSHRLKGHSTRFLNLELIVLPRVVN
jgi:hypothetical protein